jgi:hypothetical protein
MSVILGVHAVSHLRLLSFLILPRPLMRVMAGAQHYCGVLVEGKGGVVARLLAD